MHPEGHLSRVTHLCVSSSAEARLGVARRWLRSIPSDAEVLVVAPHIHAANELIHSVVTETGSRFSIQRVTSGQLASRIAAPELARCALAPATTLSLAAVVARAVHRALDE